MKIGRIYVLAFIAAAAAAFASPFTAQAVQLTEAEKVTLADLQAAFNGESNANVRYLAFAKKADEDGYAAVASLFRATAKAEEMHIRQHAAVIKRLGARPTAKIEAPVVKSTKENVEAARDGENYEQRTMYPEFLARAEAAKIADAADSLEDAMKAEGAHARLYAKALDELDSWKGNKKRTFFVCPLCGNVVEKFDWARCPICGTGADMFVKVS
jgi:rubrerythrin